MKVKLYSKHEREVPAISRILINRGINPLEINHYLNTTDKDINPPTALGEENLKAGARLLIQAIQQNKKVLIIVDPDVDGFTSSALLINWLYHYFPSFVENNLEYFLHEGKEHGLSDLIDEISKNNYDLVICPDSGSNDYEIHTQLKQNNTNVLVLDHHKASKISEDAIIINNQLSDYSNKDFSGVGVTWQFCRYADSLLKDNYAEQLLDLVALGLTADMMSLKSIETKHLINKGFEENNIHNPFIYGMWEKNKFKLGDNLTSWGTAFYIVPFVNAICRSGEEEEKKIVFESMLNHLSHKKVFSTKRGHKLGEEEELIEQALRICTNVKNRQTKAVDEGMALLEEQIAAASMMDHKVLLFLLEPNQINKNIAGLCANKIMAKYQRPCCVLIKHEEILPWSNEIVGTYYAGSARGCDTAGVADFKTICEDTNCVEYAEGHEGAFGISINKNNVVSFINQTDKSLENISSEPIYYVDYIWHEGLDVDKQAILDIADLDYLWGKDMPESLQYIEEVKVFSNMVSVMANNTLKITLPNNIPLIKFRASEEEINSLSTLKENEYKTINFITTANKNEWNGNITPQLFIKDFEIKKVNKGWIF